MAKDSFTQTASEAEEKSGFIRTFHRRADTVPNSTEARDKTKYLRKPLKACGYPKHVFVNTETRAIRKSRPTRRRI